MIARGRVQNGVIVLADGVSLPEGQQVTVLTVPNADARGHSVLDIVPVSLGTMARPQIAGEDLLGEMLEGRT